MFLFDKTSLRHQKISLVLSVIKPHKSLTYITNNKSLRIESRGTPQVILQNSVLSLSPRKTQHLLSLRHGGRKGEYKQLSKTIGDETLGQNC